MLEKEGLVLEIVAVAGWFSVQVLRYAMVRGEILTLTVVWL